jgi:hypothetical protein
MAVDGLVGKMGDINTPDLLPFELDRKVTVCIGVGGWAKGGGVSGDDRIVEVKSKEITGKWEIKPQNMIGEREGASFQNRQATKKVIWPRSIHL